MRKLLAVILLFVGVQAFAAPRTMRLDYFHTGNAATEFFSVDRVVIEPLAWPGNPNRPIDDTNLGKYLFEMTDKASGKVLYSRGFASVYGEWETTGEAKQMNRTFAESLRFPEPTAPVTVTLKKRDARNNFVEIWKTDVDPKNMFVERASLKTTTPVIPLEKNGDPANKVDFLILGDGYAAKDTRKCESDARRLVNILWTTSPFKERRKDFNVWLMCPVSPDSGISRPSTGIHKRTALGASYDAFGSERYILTYDNRALREVAQFAPYEHVEIITNTETYGGGGIFNLYGTVSADTYWAPYVFVHEFGHHFAALADEYYTSDVAYLPPAEKIEPWEPNATALLDPAQLKWRDLVETGTPLPTPWEKKKFEDHAYASQNARKEIRKKNGPESEMNRLFLEQKKEEDALFAAEKHKGKVGAFEGANYEAQGYYRPEANCIMFTRTDYFCRVCQRAINTVIDLYTK